MLATILISGLILLMVVAAIRSLIKDKNASGCGGGCSSCANASCCHPKKR